MNYPQALDYLLHQLPLFQSEGKKAYKPGLDNILQLDAWTAHPHRRFPCIHVAGTNGKGSVCHLLASVLQEAGYRTGLYTSPHLKDFRERIRINGHCISQAYVSEFTTAYIDAKKSGTTLAPDFSPSFFELTTTMAFSYFAENKVDVAIIEVGLGGRLDSTNIIDPLLSIITSISLDHMDVLGNNIISIATEKAGIIKNRRPVLAGKNPPEVYQLLQNQARQRQAPFYLAEELLQINWQKDKKGSIIRVIKGDWQEAGSFACGLAGQSTEENAALVLVALSLLKQNFKKTNTQALLRGFEKVVPNTGIRGRWEILQENPLCICDTGHNEAGLRRVTEQLAATPHKQLHIVLGVVNDKDIRAMLALLPQEAIYYFTKATVPRALPEKELTKLAAGRGLKGQSYPTVAQAKTAALKAAAAEDLVFIGGSNFVVAEAL
ncbi:MAG: bifunctional folylpolyglutamate synthase/dihydrofolate synthase [Bacteroidales bacterium]|nr:bifunctional folylpolyglutamate synthase/dihydrofolate synthase [Bacteroidales bacterium]MDD4640762.1 bifunctional folylpolyglutamate synthase/dihydrofolate synthase [Bacteroidales bacterium]